MAAAPLLYRQVRVHLHQPICAKPPCPDRRTVRYLWPTTAALLRERKIVKQRG